MIFPDNMTPPRDTPTPEPPLPQKLANATTLLEGDRLLKISQLASGGDTGDLYRVDLKRYGVCVIKVPKTPPALHGWTVPILASAWNKLFGQDIGQRFLTETNICKQLAERPVEGAVKIFKVNESCILMEYVEGQWLGELIEQQGQRLKIGGRKDIAKKLCVVRDALLEHNILHGDWCNLSNICICADQTIKLIDFSRGQLNPTKADQQYDWRTFLEAMWRLKSGFYQQNNLRAYGTHVGTTLEAIQFFNDIGSVEKLYSEIESWK